MGPCTHQYIRRALGGVQLDCVQCANPASAVVEAA